MYYLFLHDVQSIPLYAMYTLLCHLLILTLHLSSFTKHPAPPTGAVTPSEPVLSVEDPLTLTCTGSDTAETTSFTFSWLLNGNPVEASLVTDVDDVTSQLSVISVTSTDFGTYTCNVLSDHGTGAAMAYVRETGQLSSKTV